MFVRIISGMIPDSRKKKLHLLIFMTEETNTFHPVLLCLYVADSAAFLASKSVSFENILFID